jgi:hypothetical protein
MNLSDFPKAIADGERALLSQTQIVRSLKDTLELLDRRIDGIVATDPALTNEQLRRARKGELKNEKQYQVATLELRRAEEMQAALQIEVDYLKNQFSVAKLELRLRITELEAQAAA